MVVPKRKRSTWDGWQMHPPTSIATEISFAKDELAQLRAQWAAAVLAGDESVDLTDEIEEMEHELMRLRSGQWSSRR